MDACSPSSTPSLQQTQRTWRLTQALPRAGASRVTPPVVSSATCSPSGHSPAQAEVATNAAVPPLCRRLFQHWQFSLGRESRFGPLAHRLMFFSRKFRLHISNKWKTGINKQIAYLNYVHSACRVTTEKSQRKEPKWVKRCRQEYTTCSLPWWRLKTPLHQKWKEGGYSWQISIIKHFSAICK